MSGLSAVPGRPRLSDYLSGGEFVLHKHQTPPSISQAPEDSPGSRRPKLSDYLKAREKAEPPSVRPPPVGSSNPDPPTSCGTGGQRPGAPTVSYAGYHPPQFSAVPTVPTPGAAPHLYSAGVQQPAVAPTVSGINQLPGVVPVLYPGNSGEVNRHQPPVPAQTEIPPSPARNGQTQPASMMTSATPEKQNVINNPQLPHPVGT